MIKRKNKGYSYLELKTMVAWGKNDNTNTFCPDCRCEVVVRNEHAMQYAKDGVLCDDCRSERLK